MNEYFSPEQALSVCLSVCLSVAAFYISTIWPVLMKFGHMILSKFWDDTFLRFLKFCFKKVMAAILYVYECGTVAILLPFFLKW